MKISVEEDLARDRLVIVVEDDGSGMTPEFASRALDPFITTRDTRRVGLGLPLLQATAARCEGEVRIESRAGKGTKVAATFRRSHLDRPPLGDMVGTLLALVSLNPRVRFVYGHRAGEKRFTFDTAEVGRILDDVPRDHPMVVSFLRDYLAEGIAGAGL